MNAMRVLHIYKDYAPVVGGIENHIRLLAEGLRSCGIDARVLVTNSGPDTLREVIGGVPVVKTGRLLNVSSAPVSAEFYPALRRMERGIDIAHLHIPYPPGELGHLLLGRSRRTVATYHSDIVRQKALGAVYSPFLQMLLAQADLIAVSNPAYIHSSRFLHRVADKCRVIPYGIQLDRFDRTPANTIAAAQMRAQFGNALLLFVGRLRHYKGVDVLLHAMRKLDAHLLIVGTGPMEAEWRAIAEDGELNQKVTFAGDLSDSALVTAYHAADVFVLPSTNRAEAFGIVQLEAMACGLPVVCTELGTGTSFVNRSGETGFVVRPGDPEALAAAIDKLLDNEELRRTMARAAKARAHREFSNQTMLARVIAFYQEALLA
jgi:glycosyltransferase involved in cell wall biosynthesis